MRVHGFFLLLLAAGLALAGCGSLQVEAGFKQPAGLTATGVSFQQHVEALHEWLAGDQPMARPYGIVN